MTGERHGFQAEVSRLLDIVAHSLYSDKAVFLRELISNASDACDRLRYLALTQPELGGDGRAIAVTLTPDKADPDPDGRRQRHRHEPGRADRESRHHRPLRHRRLHAAADRQTQAKDMALIGQFGVGFYSAFMVADKVVVVSRKAGEAEGWRWESDGKGEFTVEPAELPDRGTKITLHLQEGRGRVPGARRGCANRRANIPTTSRCRSCSTADGKDETINQASALWTRGKSRDHAGAIHRVLSPSSPTPSTIPG